MKRRRSWWKKRAVMREKNRNNYGKYVLVPSDLNSVSKGFLGLKLTTCVSLSLSLSLSPSQTHKQANKHTHAYLNQNHKGGSTSLGSLSLSLSSFPFCLTCISSFNFENKVGKGDFSLKDFFRRNHRDAPGLFLWSCCRKKTTVTFLVDMFHECHRN